MSPPGRVAAVLAASLAGACLVPPRPRAPSPEPERAPAARPRESSASRPVTRRRASGTVVVRLGGPSGRDALTVHDPTRGEIPLVRQGDAVRARGQTRPEWRLAPAAGARGLRIEDRTYAGELRVRPGARGGLEVLNVVDLEDYVRGVVAGELAIWSAPPALLEAQAIAARSYAVAALDHRGRTAREPYLRDDTRDQAYRGRVRLGDDPARVSASARAVEARLDAAVERTRGRVLSEAGRVLDARFHAACGGHTAEGRRVFPEADFASLRAVDCAPCRERPEPTWKTTATRAELDRLARELGAGAPLRSLAPVERDASGRWFTVELAGASRAVRAPFERIRRVLGTERLPGSRVVSTWPHPGEPVRDGLAFVGRGRGHGVGLCQHGARLLAEDGWGAARILGHYYPGAALVDGR